MNDRREKCRFYGEKRHLTAKWEPDDITIEPAGVVRVYLRAPASRTCMAIGLHIRRIDTRQDNVRQSLDELRARLSPRGNVVSEAGRRRTIEVFGEPLSPQQVVERICNDVRQRGLAAVLEYSLRVDNAELTADTIRVVPEELRRAHAAADVSFLASVRRVRDNIFQFQSRLVPRDVQMPAPGGGYLRQRVLPLSRVGICVPGGAAAYPSTVLMTAVPAQAAGVRELAVVAPPTPFGAYNTAMLATCHELGITEVYRLGGAQAVAAMAYGAGMAKVDKIVGPGNLFVALAKKLVYGEVDIDSIAGPSEVVIIADHTARADFVAADLIAQAEHAPGSGILITWNQDLIDSVADELDRQMERLERGNLARQSLGQFGALILVRDAAEACALADEIASEHLHIAAENAEALLANIPHAGAVFLGHYSPVALGDYAAGPSHVLPTGGTARWASGLSATDFVRSNSVIAFTKTGLQSVADDIRTLAQTEGLTAHRASIDVRVGSNAEFGVCSDGS
jgi:histidinol dehydrogenase